MCGTGGVAKPHEHAVLFYEGDDELVAEVARYVAHGLSHGERVLVVVTPSHRAAVEALLEERVDLPLALGTGQYTTLDAAETLATFMVDGSLDPDRVLTGVGQILAAAGAHGSPVRVFGEMVALLWQAGDVLAAVELETLWNDLAARHEFELMCAYPTTDFDEASLSDIALVCSLHTAVLPSPGYDPSSVSGPLVELDDGVHAGVFVPVPEAVAALRRFITDVLERWGEEDLVWEATLVASELATNAISHGDSAFRASIGRLDGVIRIGIEDVGAGLPRQRTARIDDSDGRGMEIVEALSHRYGCEVLPHGKLVWAELLVAELSATESDLVRD
jgi:anti-sigma regulatory factor (Ser/Thr protein kinase)